MEKQYKFLRDQDCLVLLTEEELELMCKIADEMDLSTGEVVGKALRVLQKCREFVED